MFGLKRPKGETVLVVDVDDASVGASIVLLGAKAMIVHSERASLPVEERAEDHRIAAIQRLLEETAQKVVSVHATAPGAQPLAASYAIMHSPWTRFRTTQAEEVYEQPLLITDAVIASVGKKALQNPSELDAANRLESGIVHVYLNGYVTASPVGKHATRVGVAAYESDVNTDAKRAVIDTLGKVLPGRVPILRSSMSALLGVVDAHLPELHRCLILDVGSTSTHCAVVLKEAMTMTAIVPEGLTTVISKVAGGTLPEEILTKLRMLASDTCTTDACRALKDSLARIEPELAKSYGEAFAKLATPRRLPNSVVLSAPAEIEPWLAGFFSRIDFSQFTATLLPFTVESLTAEHLRDVIEWQHPLIDTSLGIAAAYVHILRDTQ
jgi:hypothetical protein